MARTDRSKVPDDEVREILDVLAPYEQAHPRAEIVAYRSGRFSIRIRIVDPDFAGQDYTDRESAVWPLLEALPEETVSNITVLLLLTPDEAQRSFANMEFEDPVPSGL